MADYIHHFPTFDPTAFKLRGYAVITESVHSAASRGATNAIAKGGPCELCGQHIKVYRRSIYSKMARILVDIITMYGESSGKWVNLKESKLVFRGGDNVKLGYWGLTTPHAKRENLYKPTELGLNFALHDVKIPRYAFVFNGVVLGFSEELRGIAASYKDSFNEESINQAVEAMLST